MLLCVRGKSGELYPEPSTAASRWRRGEAARAQRKGRRRWGASVRRVEASASKRWLGGGPERRAQRGDTPAELNREAEREAGEEDRDLNTISKISGT